MTHEQILALGFTPIESGLPTEAPHRHGYLLIEDSDGMLVYALAEWDPDAGIIIDDCRHSDGFAVLHDVLSHGPRTIDDPERPYLRLRYWKALERLNDEGGNDAAG